MELWFLQHGLNGYGKNAEEQTVPSCIAHTDIGGELAGSHAFKEVCRKGGYLVETTGTDASAQNGILEAPHRQAAETVRALLHNANLPQSYWPYALIQWALLWNITYH